MRFSAHNFGILLSHQRVCLILLFICWIPLLNIVSIIMGLKAIVNIIDYKTSQFLHHDEARVINLLALTVSIAFSVLIVFIFMLF
jgi:hypothetical protein